MKYAPLSIEEANKLSLTQAELESFNQDVEVLNALYDEILAASIHVDDFDSHIAGEMWMDALDELGISSETRRALFKVTTQALVELSKDQSTRKTIHQTKTLSPMI